MTRNVISLDNERLLRSYDRIGKKIIDFINDMDLSWEIELARRVYFGKYLDVISEDKEGISYKPFIQWLIFSYKIHNGQSLMDCVYNNCINTVSKYEKDALIGFKNTHESLYKVYSVEGDRVLVKDIFCNEMVYIWDAILSRSVKRYFGIYARVSCINNRNIAIPGYSVMSNSFLKDTEHYIIDKYKEYNKHGNYSSIHGFLNSNSLIMHRYFLYYDI